MIVEFGWCNIIRIKYSLVQEDNITNSIKYNLVQGDSLQVKVDSVTRIASKYGAGIDISGPF